jgi:hypothetical protein
MLAGKLIVQYVASTSVIRNGGINAKARWSINQATAYIEAARAAGISEEIIFADLTAAGAPVAEAPVAVAV